MQVLPLLLGLCLCPGLMAQAPHHPHAGSSPRTFSYAVPDLPLTADAEVEVFSHTAARPGAVTHLWSTACGGRWIDWQRESGIVTYRYYVDDEAAPSVQFQMRWAAGIHFDPVPTLRPNADPTASGPPPALHPNRRPPVAGDTPAPLALVLVVAVAAVAVALAVALTVGLRPGVATGLGVASALALATVVAWRPVAAPGLPLGRAVSAPVPWGTPWLGKTSDMDGYYTNVPVPFGRRVRLTAQLPPGTRPFHVYSIARGQEGGPLAVGGWPLPPDARLRLHVAHDLRVPDLAFVPLLNLSTGSGVIFGSTVAVEGHPGFVYLEGCFHLITPYTTPLRRSGVCPSFPGMTLSTGMEDYYDSSFYFSAGMFQTEISGVTHMCAGDRKGNRNCCRPNCSPGPSQWSGYRFHHRDPLWFEGGVQFLVRNGGVAMQTPAGLWDKCHDLEANATGPGPSLFSSYVWAYHWDPQPQAQRQ